MNEGALIVAPQTGELIDLTSVDLDNPTDCLQVLNNIRDLERLLRDAKAELTSALTAEFSRQGKKTLEFGNMKAELRGGNEIVWDIEVLGRLRDLGCPEERMDELIQTEITYKVNASVAKQLSMNPDYAAVIEQARSSIPKSQYVSIKVG